MHDNLMLDDEYGGLLLEGKPTLFKNQSINTSTRTAAVGNSTLFGQSVSTSAINSLSRAQLSTGNFAPSASSGVQPTAGFRPVQKQWMQSQPMSPRGDESQFLNKQSNKMLPQMQGHHEFNPNEASTLVIAEETPSFYN